MSTANLSLLFHCFKKKKNRNRSYILKFCTTLIPEDGVIEQYLLLWHDKIN